MRSEVYLRPFAETRNSDLEDFFDRYLCRASGWLHYRLQGERRKLEHRAHAIIKSSSDLPMDRSDIREYVAKLVNKIGATATDKDIDALIGVARNATALELGFRQNIRQITGALAMISGAAVEMATGEGKTTTALLAAAALALSGRKVHVITVNPYLAQRDHQQLEPIFSTLGLSSSLIREDMDRTQREEAYAQRIVYCTHKDVIFDYLRDRLALADMAGRGAYLASRFLNENEPKTVLSGLDCALVDEADSVLIDECRTPFILAATDDDAITEEAGCLALKLARDLIVQRDFRMLRYSRQIELLPRGEEKVAGFSDRLPSPWSSPLAAEFLLKQALTALHFYFRDQQYIIANDKIQIIDAATGRKMPDTSWSNGLHQLIELKEGITKSRSRSTICELTFQRFFPRYRLLSGMSGTLKEVVGELAEVYHLRTVAIPTAKPSQLRWKGTNICVSDDEKWKLVAKNAEFIAVCKKRPVLIGTRSVAESEKCSRALFELGLAHTVLNAKQDCDEATLVELAGCSEQVTVATNMAGRGTDIPISGEVAARGGLHVVLTSLNESRRIDRQLFGRAARQGLPGSCESIVSLEDEVLVRFIPNLSLLLRYFPRMLRRPLGVLLSRYAQMISQKFASATRRQAFEKDRKMKERFAFAKRVD